MVLNHVLSNMVMQGGHKITVIVIFDPNNSLLLNSMVFAKEAVKQLPAAKCE